MQKKGAPHVTVCRIPSVTLLAWCVLAQRAESAWDKNLGGSLETAFLRFDVDLLLESKSEEAQKQIESAPGDIELNLLDNNHLLMPQKGFVLKYLYVAGPNLL